MPCLCGNSTLIVLNSELIECARCGKRYTYKRDEKGKIVKMYIKREKTKKSVTEPNILDSGVIFLCESGKRVFYRVGQEFKADRDFIVKCGMFSSEEILWYDEAQRVRKKELKERRCERDRKELEILKKRLGEC